MESTRYLYSYIIIAHGDMKEIANFKRLPKGRELDVKCSTVFVGGVLTHIQAYMIVGTAVRRVKGASAAYNMSMDES